MGKITRSRTKYHTPAAEKQAPVSDLASASTLNFPNVTVPDNLFSGLDIPQSVLETAEQNLKMMDNEDARSTMSKKSFKSDLPYSKKDKRLIRREAFLMKLNAVKSAEMEEKKKKKRQKTVIVGDMKPMFDSLPSLMALQTKAEKLRPTKERSVPKIKTQSMIHNERIARYKDAFLDFCKPKKN